MTEIKKVFGVIPGAADLGLFGSVEPHFMSPSRDLQAALADLPPGTTVGLEHTPETTQPTMIDGQEFRFDPACTWYWQEIETICRESGLTIAYLDNFRLLTAASKKLHQAQVLLEKAFRGEESFTDYWQLRREAYKKMTEFELILSIKREIAMWKLIPEVKPDVLLLGKDHVDLLMTSPKARAVSGLQVGEYQTEAIPEYGERVSFDTDGPRLDVLTERRQMVRAYRAVTKGRITPARNPAYIGIFTLGTEYTPEQGLFELYPTEDGSFSGTISDTFGEATFEGSISDKRVSFEKIYDRKKSLPNAAPQPLQYDGEMNKGVYEGGWQFQDFGGGFQLVPYTPGMDTKAFMDNLVQERSSSKKKKQ